MSRRRHAIVFLCVLLGLVGCGIKTPPIPPQSAIPAPIEDLVLKVSVRSVTLSWTYPEVAESGAELDKIRTFQLFKSEVVENDYCSGCPVQYDPFITLSADRGKPGSRVRYTDSALKPGYHYDYKVVSSAGWNIVSRDSNRISFAWENPPRPPTDLVLDVADQGLTLHWQPVQELSDGGVVSGSILYQVFRRRAAGKFERIGDPVGAIFYRDEGLRNGEKYFYKVRALHKVDGTNLVGEDSDIVAGTPRDMSPPPVPERFEVVATTAGAELLWEDVGGKDVAGYKIYRRRAGQKEYVLVGVTDRRSFSYVDKSLPAGKTTLYYALTAFDRATPPNESGFSEEVALVR
ncbi:MAG: fibronectin type III domain-containing protein [Desulfobulbaceae bacterium]|nr:fibronectin type III domain-containing protein [Desulfobulbaceae bacterium]